ncbi:polysaccharide deacetylase family protein [Pseudomonas fluorescens]|uniref:Polysaccharide deacetylase family protein n=1 Tax=Pseudomonas fluorescens TaxID=294 RepID=A0AAE2U2P7_PSEFL|nr:MULTISPECIES: polysaccharide deacetylase family protein [Pseudomonas fluorescens group]MBA1430549.1 polysaccharide deacetylase family protein [Pseudomonas orientalis]MBD8146814.1 polysaccharide deacetylase family protein [Pseudomonas fluorescens]MBD8175258.1 polysaccharide deacetylase family protein [Pseudomonas fluorescens]MBD8268569.1 polysaccharide deacetylase family protein [Pseudomonas fluorescens]MBD8743714.1 polysaccharide deacetylase family protein [Pseudomonas fluorescens]
MKTFASAIAVFALALSLGGCIGSPIALTPQTEQRLQARAPIRFLLTFDDGPSASGYNNPSRSVVADLAHNPVLPGIKAVFFVQTEAARSGGSARGRKTLVREHAAGHVLAFHTATAFHTNHRWLNDAELERTLSQGAADIAAITGTPPLLVRPPFWNYDRRTFAAYQRHGMQVLLTDLSANDGKIWGFNGSPRRRANLYRQLSVVRERIALGELPTVDGVIPVVVTFHDINRYTARHMQEYLQILMDSARINGLKTATEPFYTDTVTLQRAALARTVKEVNEPVHLPGVWNWLWDADSN